MNTGNEQSQQTSPTGHRFGWQRAWPLWILGCFFGVIFAVNGTMAYLGAISFTGLTTEQAYEKGRTYNNELARRDVQKKLGWTAALESIPQTAEGKHLVLLKLVMTKEDQQPLTGATVQVLLVRPTHEGYDRNITLTEAGAGTYRAHVDLPLPGQWEVRALVTAPAGEYRLVERISAN